MQSNPKKLVQYEYRRPKLRRCNKICKVPGMGVRNVSMRTKQASSSDWIGEPRLPSHPRLRFFDMAPRQTKETENSRFTSAPSPRHRFHEDFVAARFNTLTAARDTIEVASPIDKCSASSPRILARATVTRVWDETVTLVARRETCETGDEWDPKKTRVAPRGDVKVSPYEIVGIHDQAP